MTWSYDYAGHLLGHVDLGGASSTYTYSYNGRLLGQTSSRGQNLAYSYYENGQVKQITDNALNAASFYEYDAAGNRTRESTTKGGVNYQDVRLTFDALGRMTRAQDNRYTLTYEYDANGNRKRALSSYYDKNNALQVIDNWYRYDGMNRIVLSQGVLANGSIQIGTTQGTALAYDAAGNRRQATTYVNGTAVTESYTYDGNNRLLATTKGGSTTSSRTYDAAGQLIEQVTYSSPGVVSERRTSSYNANGWLTEQDVYNGSNTQTQRTLFTAYDRVGNNTAYQVQVLTGTQYTNYYTTTYAKYDGYKESKVAGTSTYFLAGNTITSYDVNGNITAVSESFKTSKNRSFVTDQTGHILQKTENGKTQNYFYANEKSLGSSGALSAADFDYNYTPVSAQYPNTAPGDYVVSAGDTLRGIALALFGDAQLWYLIADANGLQSDADLQVGQNLTIPNKITNLRNASDTFKPYEPGKIIGDTTPTLPDPPPPKSGGGCGGIGGIIVAIVAVVAAVFTAGAAALAMAGTLGSASGFGAIMTAGMSAMTGGLVGSGIAVSAAAGGGMLGGLAMAGAAAIGGMVGSIVGQGVGIAMGVQDKFSWSAVGRAGLSAGIGSGVGPALQGAGLLSAPTSTTALMFNAAITSVATQGVSIAVGLQNKFSWGAVAGSAVSAGLNGILPQASSPVGDVLRGTLIGVTSRVVSQAVSGGRIDMANIAADAFGNALGSSLAQQSSSSLGTQEALLNAENRKLYIDTGYKPADYSLGGGARLNAVSDSSSLGSDESLILAGEDAGYELRYPEPGEIESGEFVNAGANAGRTPNSMVVTARRDGSGGERVTVNYDAPLGQCTPDNPYGLSADEKAVADYVIRNPLSGGVSSDDLNQYQRQYIEEGIGNRISIQNVQANSPSLTSGESFTLTPAEHSRWYVATRSSFNMLGASAGMVQGLAVTGVGVGLSATPASPVGWVVTAGGAVHTAKNLSDFSLNAVNLWKATVGSGGYYEDSIFEQIVDWSGGSKADKQWAAVANLGYELGTMKVTNLPGFTYDYGRAALLQAPYMPTFSALEFQAARMYGNTWGNAVKISDRALPVSLGSDVNENILNPFEYGIMPQPKMTRP